VSRGDFTVANGINGSGQIVGYYLDEARKSFFWPFEYGR
jgi:hypothetical protein